MGQSLAANFGPAQVVAIEGPDARRFAAGLFTNDVRTLGVGDSQRQAACDARGRLLGLFDLLAPGPEALLAVLEGQSAEDFVAWFGRYLLMDDAALEVRDTPGAVHLTVQGPGARERLELKLFKEMMRLADPIVYHRGVVQVLVAFHSLVEMRCLLPRHTAQRIFERGSARRRLLRQVLARPRCWLQGWLRGLRGESWRSMSRRRPCGRVRRC